MCKYMAKWQCFTPKGFPLTKKEMIEGVVKGKCKPEAISDGIAILADQSVWTNVANQGGYCTIWVRSPFKRVLRATPEL